MPMLEAVEQQAKGSGLDFTRLTMHGYGHAQPTEYLDAVGRWARGEALPETFPAPPR
jgi:hypothetical protein